MELFLTKEELKVLELFRENIFQECTIREIQKKLGKNSYNWVFRTIKKQSKSGILSLEKKGNTSLCSVNLYNNLTLDYLSIIEKKKIFENKKLPIKNIKSLINSMDVSYFSFIITGSYAKGKAKKSSDLDVVVILENKDDVRRNSNILRNKGELMNPQAHVYVFSKKEFLEMLLDREENYGKEVFRNNLIFFGAENYYLILREAIENGFKN